MEFLPVTLAALAGIGILNFALSLIGTVFTLFLALVVFAHLPFKAIQILEESVAPDDIKKEGRKQMIEASIRSYLSLPFDLLSPLVVPFLLIFTKTEDDRLKFLDSVWGNDSSINGDVRIPGSVELRPISTDMKNQEEIDLCYWAKGHHPRSFYARWVWLGLRNRASALSQNLGKEVHRGTSPDANYRFWASDETSFDGWNLKKEAGKTTYVIRAVNGLDGKPVISVAAFIPTFLNKHRRIYFGYKVPLLIPQWKKAQLASVGWSLR